MAKVRLIGGPLDGHVIDLEPVYKLKIRTTPMASNEVAYIPDPKDDTVAYWDGLKP